MIEGTLIEGKTDQAMLRFQAKYKVIHLSRSKKVFRTLVDVGILEQYLINTPTTPRHIRIFFHPTI